MKRAKITVVGAGNVGATCALYCAQAGLGDVVLLDTPRAGDMPKGKALDLAEAAPVLGYTSNLTGTTDYADTANSDVVVVTAGVARKPGMSRDDLLSINAGVVGSVGEQIKATSPNAVVIVVSNPVDTMVQRMCDVTGFPHSRVIGQAGVLDAARFCCFIAMELGVSPEDVNAMLLGGHGDSMVPLASCSSVGGIPVTQLIAPDRLAEIVQRTRVGGGEIVNLLGTGSAYYAPAASTAKMVQAIVRDENRVLACVAYCDQEYSVGGYYVGVPVVLGDGGVKKIVNVDMTLEEKALFAKSCDAVRTNVANMQKVLEAQKQA
ncbi:MAG: malate dehydrogenase [Planctomycetia bacterium]|nr:malate dehydrogenase [Planctomycetia bacterium]